MMESASGEDVITQNVRKHTSKWDLVADTQFPNETVQENSLSGDKADVLNDKELNSGLNSSGTVGSYVPKLSGIESNNAVGARHSTGEPCRDPLLEGDEGQDGIVDRDREETSFTVRTWGGEQSYGASMDPPSDGWRQRSRSRSPKRGWSSRSHRSRSRSRSWGRCRSRSWSRSRSRTRSKSRSRSPYGFRHEAEGWNERSRNGKRGSTEYCRDFAAGRCSRGSQCRFLHQDERDNDGRGHFDRGSAESRGRRHERGGFSRYANDEVLTDSPEHSGYSREKLSYGYVSHNDGDREKHEPQRNSRSSVRCNNFLKGKCYRGSACKYVHHGVNADGHGGWSSRDATRERIHSRRDTDASFGHDWKHQSHRSSDMPCKFFPEGRCRNGERCKFSHQGPTRGGPEPKSQDGRWGDSSGIDSRSLDGSKWSDHNSSRTWNQSWNGSKWGDGAVDRNASSDQSWGGQKCGNKEADKNVQCSPWSGDSNNERAEDPRNRSREDSKFGDNAIERNIKGVPESWIAQQCLNDTDVPSAVGSKGYPLNIDGKESLCNLQDTRGPQGADQQPNVVTLSMQPLTSETGRDQYHSGLISDAATFHCEEVNKYTNGNNNNSGNNLPAVIPVAGQSTGESQNQHAFHPPASVEQRFNPNEQSQPMAFPPNLQNQSQNQLIEPPHLSARNVNLTMQSQPLAPPPISGQMDPNGQIQWIRTQPPSAAQSEILLGQGESIKKRDLLEVNTPQLVSETPVTQNAVTTDKGAKIPDLSVSLAQIFGDGQQLPQLYATLNHLTATGMVPSHSYSQSNSATFSAPTEEAQPNQGPWPQKQYDPINDSTEPMKTDINYQHQGFSLNSHAHSSSIEESHAPEQILAPSVTVGSNNSGLEKAHLEDQDKQHEMSMGTDAVDLNKSETAQQGKEQQVGQLKDMDDGQVDEDGKKSKDSKGMKMFKFALVEFVKELLKPTWKEGHMSKEAHKTIVKKVVDKVTGSMESSHIPQTQDKIDQYLSYSKSKLTKLVNAYVEKYLKT